MKPAFVQALEFQNQGGQANRQKARSVINKLLDADPDNAVLLLTLGLNFVAENHNGLAIALFRQALQGIAGAVEQWERLGVTVKSPDVKTLKDFVRKSRADLFQGLGCAWRNENKPAEARRCFAMARSLIPHDFEYDKRIADLTNNEGTLYLNEGTPEKGIPMFKEAVRLNPKHDTARWNLSLCQLETWDWEGWDNYEYGECRLMHVDRNYEVPRWDGMKKDQVLVVNGEQGIGDEIMFSSCLPDLQRDSKAIVFDCHKRLKSIFEASFPSIAVHGTREDEWIDWPRDYKLEAKFPLGSLPGIYRRHTEQFPSTPYLKAPYPGKFAERLRVLGNRPKIGISWIGGHKKTRLEVRSLELEQMLPILQHDAAFISLQYTQFVEEQVAELKAKHGITVHHWQDITHAEDYGDTASLVADLDLVISVCTSVIHLAGALGTRCWIMVPSRPAWRYGISGSKMPWYGSVEMFRMAKASSDWAPVVSQIDQRLAGFLDERAAA